MVQNARILKTPVSMLGWSELYQRVVADRLLVNGGQCEAQGRSGAPRRHGSSGQNDGPTTTPSTCRGGRHGGGPWWHVAGELTTDQRRRLDILPPSLRSTLADVDSIRLSNAWCTVLLTRWAIDDELNWTVRGSLTPNVEFATHEVRWERFCTRW